MLKDLFVNKLTLEFASRLPVINPRGREFNEENSVALQKICEKARKKL